MGSSNMGNDTQYLIEHVPVLKDHSGTVLAKNVNSKKEVRYYYYRKYTHFLKDYKTKLGLKKYDRTSFIPLCLRSFKIFLAYNNLWWLFHKQSLTEREIKILKEKNIKVYF